LAAAVSLCENDRPSRNSPAAKAATMKVAVHVDAEKVVDWPWQQLLYLRPLPQGQGALRRGSLDMVEGEQGKESDSFLD